MKQNNTNAPFLATTALEEFWDTSRPILFLGEWCRRYSRKDYWQQLEGEVAQSPWPTIQDAEASWTYAVSVYEEVLACLAAALNELHGTDHQLRYWRIVVGPWLLYYIHVSLERFLRIKNTLEQHPDLTTTCLSEKSFVVPRESMEYVELCKTDLYNLQIYSTILTFFGKKFPTIEAEKRPDVRASSKEHLTARLFFSKAVNFLIKKISLAIKNYPGVMIKSSFFSPGVEILLFLRTAGRVRLVSRKPICLPDLKIDGVAREGLRRFLHEGDDFRKYIKSTIPLDIPRSMVECFDFLLEEVQKFPSRPTAVFTSNAYFFDEAFKVWAASKAEEGVPLLGSQHGGNYGISKYLPPLDHEKAICDRYYTWGWKDAGCFAETIPFTAVKLAGRLQIGADNHKKGILLPSTTHLRYLINFPYLPEYFEQYLLLQRRFTIKLNKETLLALLVRLNAEDFGWDLHARWSDSFPDVMIEQEGGSSNFMDSLQKCRLLVADHISTTYIEALSANKPTVMFYNESTFIVRAEAKEYLDLLKQVGILHESPESAAETVNRVYANVEAWWNDPVLQAARTKFCDSFGRTSADALGEWTHEFLGILEKPSACRNMGDRKGAL